MNPDKLFDYLDGKLSATERAALEERLTSDQQLQREIAVARRIHAGMRSDSREVLLPEEADVSERGRKMARRVGAAFIILMAVNVGVGLWLIARHETKNQNRASLEAQTRQQLTKSLEQAAATELTPAPFGVSDRNIASDFFSIFPPVGRPNFGQRSPQLLAEVQAHPLPAKQRRQLRQRKVSPSR
ncbi:MAG: hypothetical protein DME36_10660 [Verrucomicrobia bacterium]|nr:MAG: hypothetical protein DME36_10660 [Verrucomicrobiota bacterium]